MHPEYAGGVLYVNRAMCYKRLGKFAAVEEDCTRALQVIEAPIPSALPPFHLALQHSNQPRRTPDRLPQMRSAPIACASR